MFNFFANRRKTKAAQAACDAFNARHRIGTPVIVRDQLIETTTASPARVVACNAVIDLHFKGGSILLEVLLEKVVPHWRKAPASLRPSYPRNEATSSAPAHRNTSYTEHSWPFTPTSSHAADPEPAIVSGGGGSFGGGGASSSWSSDSPSDSSSSSSSSSSDSSSCSSTD